VVEKLAKDSGLPLSVFKLKRGPVAKTIVSEADAKRARLVVMGTVGRRGVKAKLMGNTAEDVLALLRMDTLTIKP
jgi:universal stress protein E